MEAPPVQFVRTSDGYDIAYTVSGKGPPLVVVPFHISHVLHDWEVNAATEPWLRELSKRFTLIRYDARGQGMSTRHLPPDLPRDAWLRDLEAVIDSQHLNRFILMGINIFGHLAVVYAAAHPERLEALILLNCRPSVAEWMVPLAEQSWDLLLRTHISPDIPADLREAELARLKLASKQADYVTSIGAFSRSDVSEDAARIRTPTLLLHGRDVPWFGPDQATALAARIPESRLVLLDGAIMPNTSQGLEAIKAFMAELDLTESAVTEPTPEPPRGLLTNQPGSAGARDPLSNNLSLRQVEVLRLVATGRTNREIADELSLSLRTIERHVEDIYAKTGVRNRSEATAFALGHAFEK
jgi:pimeloyl-ACP methyl ester carboxylesterase/DNA-binding CsgD family transcriptional regulator